MAQERTSWVAPRSGGYSARKSPTTGRLYAGKRGSSGTASPAPVRKPPPPPGRGAASAPGQARRDKS